LKGTFKAEDSNLPLSKDFCEMSGNVSTNRKEGLKFNFKRE
jgi:hypothetical protein